MKIFFKMFMLCLLVSLTQVNATDNSLTLDVETTSFTPRDHVKLSHAIDILKNVMNSKEFKDALLEFNFNEQF